MIIDGKKIAEKMLTEAAEEIKKMPKPARLAAVLVGDSASSRGFLELKKRATEKIGIDFRMYKFPADITTQKLRKEVGAIAKAGVNHGVIIELPLPSHINNQYILNAIPQEKDADVLSEKSQGAFFVNRSAILPPAVEAVGQIFKNLNIEIPGKHCAVFGYGQLVGKPISHWLAQQGATVSIINEFTPNPEHYTLDAEIIISGVGKPNLIKAGMIKNQVIVIDFGYNKLPITNSQRLIADVIGDIEFSEVSKKASLITPVPGGVGPIVIAAVLKNLVTLYKTQIK